MANPQTTEVTSEVLYGAVLVEVSASSDMSSAVDIGAANGVKLTEEMTISTLESDNAVDRDIVTEQKATIEYDQLQMLNEEARVIMRGDLDTIVTTAGVEVEDYEQTISAIWKENTFYPFDKKQSTGAVPTAISLEDSVGTFTITTDYIITKNAAEEWGVIIFSTATTTPANAVTITYTYTPASSVDYYTGGKSELSYFYCRLTNTDENGKIVKWTTLGKCNISTGDEITFQKYNADDTRISVPVKIQVRQDITLDTGKQLLKRTVEVA